LIYSCLGVTIFLTGCGTGSGNTAAGLSACTSSTPEANPYTFRSQSGAVQLYTNYKNGWITLDNARQAAFSQLGRNTEHWSDYVDIAIDDAQMIRVTVTYIDPVLIQYIVLNHALFFQSSMDAPTFDGELKFILDKLAKRNELLFVVTITAPLYKEQAYNSNVLTVRLPIKQMALINAGDLRAYPTHDDHILDENIPITHGPVSGIVGYPLSVLYQDNCIWFMDQWNTTLTLDIPLVTLGATQFTSQFWSIPYRPMIIQDDAHLITFINDPVPAFDPNYNWGRISRSEKPPQPLWIPNADVDSTDWKTYWEDMGRYLWYLFITESHH